MTMTEKKHAIKPYPLGAHVEDGAIRFAYASGKKDCGILIYDRKSGKKTHRVPFRQEERMGNVYCKYLELKPENVGYQFYEGERTVPDLHAQGFLRKPAYGKIRKPADRIAVFPNEDFDWEQDMHPMLPYLLLPSCAWLYHACLISGNTSRHLCRGCGEAGLSSGNRCDNRGIPTGL